MRSELDNLLFSHNLDALLVIGPTDHNPPMVYLTGIANMTSAVLLKKRGEEPVLFYRSIERDEAAATGHQIQQLDDEIFFDSLREYQGNALKVNLARLQRLLGDMGCTTARLEIAGRVDAGEAYALFSALQGAMPGLAIVGEYDSSVLIDAMQTKDEQEVERIRRMGQVTTSVVGKVADFLTSHRTRDGVLVKLDGEPLKVSDVKSRINLWLAEQGAENPEGTIFAIGYDATVPHSSGNPNDPLRLGQTIIFDIFPCELGGGYFHDFTRTWCLGYATDEALSLYEDVFSVHQQLLSELRPNAACNPYQARACELFEARGHQTQRVNPQAQNGYVHGLGHGLGLYIHQRPFFSLFSNQDDRLIPGVVVTVEPGLYYPEREMAVRLEDTVWVRPDGEIEILAKFPYDLVLPIS